MANGQIYTGVKWTTLSVIVNAVFVIIKIYFLAHHLSKTDFGTFAIVTSIITFLNLLADMGLTAAIMHVQKLTIRQSSSMFWLTLSFAVILSILLSLVSPLIASFYKMPALKLIIPISSINLIIAALGRMPYAIDRKNMKFVRIEVISIISSFIANGTAIILAINGFGIWSMVVSSVLFIAIIFLTYFFIGLFITKSIRFYFSINESKYFVKIGAYHFLAKGLSAFTMDIDSIIIGKLLGLELLGLYALAKELASKPFLVSGPFIDKVFSPFLAKHNFDVENLKGKFLSLLKFNSYFNVGVMVVFIISANEIVKYLYGPNYSQIIGLSRLLSVVFLLRAINGPVMALIVAMGKTLYDFQWNLLQIIIVPLFLIVGAQFGLYGVAISFIVMSILLIYPSWYFFGKRLLGLTFKEQLLAYFT